MSTTSLICKKNPDGTYTGIYCHWDGYLKENGRILEENYENEETINKLLDLGDLSSLGTTPEDPGNLWDMERDLSNNYKFDFESWAPYRAALETYCRSYRSRGEHNIDAHTYKSLRDVHDHGENYTYVWDAKNGWRYISFDTPKWTRVSVGLKRLAKKDCQAAA